MHVRHGVVKCTEGTKLRASLSHRPLQNVEISYPEYLVDIIILKIFFFRILGQLQCTGWTLILENYYFFFFFYWQVGMEKKKRGVYKQVYWLIVVLKMNLHREKENTAKPRTFGGTFAKCTNSVLHLSWLNYSAAWTFHEN